MFRASDIYGASRGRPGAAVGPQGPSGKGNSTRNSSYGVRASPWSSSDASWCGGGESLSSSSGGGWHAGPWKGGCDYASPGYGKGGKGGKCDFWAGTPWGGDYGWGWDCSAAGKGKGSDGKGKNPSTTEPTRPTVPQHVGPATVQIIGTGFWQGCEQEVEEAARAICITGGFSTPETVRFVSALLLYIDFPHKEAAKDFVSATWGSFQVGTRQCKVQRPNAAQRFNDAQAMQVGPEAPTETLVVRQIQELSEDELFTAFQAMCPTVKGVRTFTDPRTGKSKGYAFVNFWSVTDAMSARDRVLASGGRVCERKVAINYARPNSLEQVMSSDVEYRKEQNEIKAQAEQALEGINGDMWSNYLKYFEEQQAKAQSKKKP